MDTLAIVKSLIADMNDVNMQYCHFKSNEHLDAALRGDTDLDVLFSEEQRSLCEKILYRNKFVRMRGVSARKYPGIEDYIGIDKETGRVVHVHGHYKMMGGESGVKPYHIKLEKWLLNNRQPSKDGIYIASPEAELILLLIRTTLKQSWWKGVASTFIGGNLSNDEVREIAWLKERVDRKKLISVLPSGFQNADVASFFQEILDRQIQSHDVYKFYTQVSHVLNKWRTMTFSEVIAKRVNYYFVRFNKKFPLVKKPTRRIYEGKPGLIVAIMGCDGSGKSTQTELVTRELRRKVDTSFYYMGSGNGSSKWYRFPLKWLAGLKYRSGAAPQIGTKNNETELQSASQHKSLIRKFLRIIWGCVLAYERRGKMKEISALRKAGATVICDRYPQSQTMLMNDGPLLSEYKDSIYKILRRISRWESSIYDTANEVPPDLVIKLWAPVDTLKERRVEMSYGKLKVKQNKLLNIVFPNETRMIEIESVGGVKCVFAKIMSEISVEMMARSPEKPL